MATLVTGLRVGAPGLLRCSRVQGVVSLRLLSNRKDNRKDTSKTGVPAASAKDKDQTAEYKVQEYFQYNPQSYYDIDIGMRKYRLEQPTPSQKY